MVKVLIYIIVSNIGWFLFVELVKAIVPDVVFVIVFTRKVNQNNLFEPQVSVLPFNSDKELFLNLYAPIPRAITATANTIPPKKDPPLKPKFRYFWF